MTKRTDQDQAASAFLKAVEKTLTERASTYPPYSEEAEKVAKVWNALHPDKQLEPAQVPELMMIVKLVRHAGGNSRDSLTDLVGYAARLEGML